MCSSSGVVSRWCRSCESVRSTGSRTSVRVTNGASSSSTVQQREVTRDDADLVASAPASTRSCARTRERRVGGTPSSGAGYTSRSANWFFSRCQSAVPAVFCTCTKKNRCGSFMAGGRSQQRSAASVFVLARRPRHGTRVPSAVVGGDTTKQRVGGRPVLGADVLIHEDRCRCPIRIGLRPRR